MKAFPLLAASAVTAMTLALPAEAARRGGSEHQDLLFVSATEFSREGQPWALCQLTTTTSKFFINFWRSVDTYALAPNNCNATEYFSMSAEDIASAKAEGMIPASIPDEPKLSAMNMIQGMWGIGLGIGMIGFFGAQSFMSGKRRKERESLMGNVSPATMAILDAMCHAAKADGSISEDEVAQIAHAARELTGEEFDLATVRRIAELAETEVTEADCRRFIKPLADSQARVMMQGVLTVVAADGQLAGKEQEFVAKLMAAMKMQADDVNGILGEVMRGHSSQPA